jgi:hypothetical protein
MEFHVCPTCAVGLVNDDWSSVDCEDTYTSILAWLEVVGYLVHVKEIDKGGYYDCPCCGETHIGTAHIFQHWLTLE